MPASTPSPNIPLSDLYEDNQAIAKRPEPLSVRRQHEWLHRFKQWIGLDANLWKAKKVLGAGGNGVVGLWEYQGNNTLFPRNIVIKQGHDDPESMAWESKLLRQITGTGTEHVVKLYKGYHRDGGSGTSDLFDPLPFEETDGDECYKTDEEVTRLYMEYCENGDMQHLLEELCVLRIESKYGDIPEENIWRILGCRAKAALVLEMGTEDPDAPGEATWPHPIAHFDIKPANILIGNRDSTDHKRLEIFKLADFGLALAVPDNANSQNTDWINSTRWRATKNWASPEQAYEDHPSRTIGSETNIWAIGAVICRLVTNTKRSSKAFTWQCQGTTYPFWTQGIGLLDPYYGIYSRTLIDTIFKCLAYDPAIRITAVDLVKTTNHIEAIYHEMYDGVDIGDDPLRDGDLLNARPMGHALLYDAYGNGPAKPRPFNLGPVGVFEALGKPSMSPEMEGIELLFLGPYTQREAVAREDYPFETMEDTPPASPAAPPPATPPPAVPPPAAPTPLKWESRLRSRVNTD